MSETTVTTLKTKIAAIFDFRAQNGMNDVMAPVLEDVLSDVADELTTLYTGNANIGDGLLETDATTGFAYIPTCAGAPTGDPAVVTGYLPLVINSTTGKLYFHDGTDWALVTSG